MNQTDQIDQRSQRSQFEDETELIDYLRVIWKWKWLIIGGTLLCILAVAIYGYTRPVVRMYKVSTLIEIDPKAKLDPLDKIKSMIEYGIFNQEILNDLSKLGEENLANPGSLSFEVKIPKDLNILDITYQAPNTDSGKAVINALIKQLKLNYKGKLDRAKSEIDEMIKDKRLSLENIQDNIKRLKLSKENQISQLKADIKAAQDNIQKITLSNEKEIAKVKSNIAGVQSNMQLIEGKYDRKRIGIKNEISKHTYNIKALGENIQVLNNRIDELEGVLKKAKRNSERLQEQRNSILSNPQNEGDYRDIFLYSAAIQQVMSYPIELSEQIDSMGIKERESRKEIDSVKSMIQELEAQLLLLETEKINIIKAEKDKIKDLEAQIEILTMEKNSSIQKEQDKTKEKEAEIRLTELETNQKVTVEENKIAVLKSEIESLKHDRDKITGVIVKRPPAESLIQIKYKAKRNALLIGTIGFVFFIFLAFFIEYLKNASKRI